MARQAKEDPKAKPQKANRFAFARLCSPFRRESAPPSDIALDCFMVCHLGAIPEFYLRSPFVPKLLDQNALRIMVARMISEKAESNSLPISLFLRSLFLLLGGLMVGGCHTMPQPGAMEARTGDEIMVAGHYI